MVKKTLNDFKEFAMRGNVIDLAIGIILGTAFNKIVSSVVSDVFMPLLSTILGRINISTLKFVINSTILGLEPIEIRYGAFLQAVIDFIAIAFCIFIFVKIISKFRKKNEAAPSLSKTEELLTEIKELLKEQNEQNRDSGE
jgi:large conductance mechanosensitive channel